MKKIIAVLLSIMLTFGIATSALAVSNPTDSPEITTAVTKPDDSRVDDEETPSTTCPVLSTDAPLTTEKAPADVDPKIPEAEKEPSILDRLYNAIMIFIKEMVQIIDDSCDKLIDFIDRHNN